MSLRTTLHYIARKTLYLWVKTGIIPSDIKSLDLNPHLPIIYVLETRSWANLLVLEEECQRLGLPAPLDPISSPELKQWHSVYTIVCRQPFKAWLNKQPKRSRMLRGIIETLHDTPEQDIQFVPVSIFWGRPVATQKHWLQVLFADSWSLAGRTRMFFKIIFQGRNTFVQFSEVISYRDNNTVGKADDEIIDTLQRTLSTRLKKIRTATLGPDVSHRRTLVRNLLLKPAVQEAIAKRSEEDGISSYKATLQAQRYLKEIVANCSNITIQIMQRALSTFWNRFYSGIEVHNSNYLKSLALSHEIIYVPCHRSHIDYLLLSYVIYYEGLAIPYIAAGKNLNMPIIGKILRGGGAFFIRRSFKGNELYSTVMFEYLAELVGKGVPIEYFVEGGRSRTGRLLQAKPGLLSMTVRGFLKYRQRPIAFIPVNISYERLMESKEYQAELSGKTKKGESFINSIRSILKIRGEFGKVYTNFGSPIFLNKILDTIQPEWEAESAYDDTQRPPWIRDVVGTLSQDIMKHINQASTVHSIHLLSSVLLATPKQSIDEQRLVQQLEMYQAIIKDLNYSNITKITTRTGKEQIEQGERLNMLQRRNHELGDILYLDAKHAVSTTYYRNNILHLLALPSLIACCFFETRTQSRESIDSLITLTYPFLQKELFLTWDKEQLESAITLALNSLVEQDLLLKNHQENSYTRQAPDTQSFSQLNLLAKVISPILEVYYLTLALLSLSSKEKVTRKELEQKCYLMAQRVAMIYEFNSPDYSDKKLIANFIDTLIHIDYVEVFDTEKLAYGEVFHKADKRIRLLLPREKRSNILQILRVNQLEQNKEAS